MNEFNFEKEVQVKELFSTLYSYTDLKVKIDKNAKTTGFQEGDFNVCITVEVTSPHRDSVEARRRV